MMEVQAKPNIFNCTAKQGQLRLAGHDTPPSKGKNSTASIIFLRECWTSIDLLPKGRISENIWVSNTEFAEEPCFKINVPI